MKAKISLSSVYIPSDDIVAREIEGSLIDLLEPCCNHKDEHRRWYGEDDLIPAEYLYDV